MSEHPLSARQAEEVRRLSYFLQGVAASAIAFAMHETADRPASLSLLVIATAVVAWGLSFAAGVLNSHARQVAMKGALALDLIDFGKAPESRRDEAQKQYEKYNTRAVVTHQIQVWGLLAGALLYASGQGILIFSS